MKKKSISTQIIYSIIFAIAVYLVLSIWGSSGNLKKAFNLFNWNFFPLLLLMAFLNYCLRFLKWQYYLKILKIELPVKDSFIIHMSGLGLAITPGKFGEVVKSYFLKKIKNEPYSRTAPIVFADRLSDLMSLIILCALGAAGFSYGKNLVWAVALVIVAIFLIIIIKPIGQQFINILAKLPFLNKRKAKLQILYDSSYVLLRPKRIIFPLIISVISWSFEALAFYFVFIGFGLNNTIGAAFFIYSFSTILGAVSMLPGGLGATEGAIVGLLNLLKINQGISSLATLIIRAATLWFAVIIGLIFLVIAERKFKVSLDSIEKDAN